MDKIDPVNFLLSIAEERKTVLGSQIGAALFKEFPQLKQDSNFGSLRTFIQTNCKDKLILTGDHKGADDIYQYVPEGEPTPPPLFEAPKSAWTVFQKPNTKGFVAVNTKTGRIRVLDRIESLDENERSVEPLSLEDHKLIAKNFLEAGKNIPNKHEYEEILVLPDYWAKWSQLINRSGHKSNWAFFRNKAIRELFNSRMTGFGMDQTIIRTALAELSASRKNFPSSNHISLTPNKDSHAEYDLRKSIHSIIDRLSDDELRRIWLPIGLASDTLGS